MVKSKFAALLRVALFNDFVFTVMDNRIPRINNSSALIQEVKKHIVLYDNRAGNPDMKKKSWEEVAKALFGEERWNQFSDFEKEGIGECLCYAVVCTSNVARCRFKARNA